MAAQRQAGLAARIEPDELVQPLGPTVIGFGTAVREGGQGGQGGQNAGAQNKVSSLRACRRAQMAHIHPMSIFWQQDVPFEQRLGNLIGDAICAAMLILFVWAYLSAFL